MNHTILALIILISPILFLCTALASWFQPGMRPDLVKRMAASSAIVSCMIAAISGFFVINYGSLETSLLGSRDLGFSLRLDAVSILMFSMIALLSFIIVRFSKNYMDGDERQGAFVGRLAATIASVQLLVLSGNLGLLFISWVLTSISLHRLLVFYRHRPAALIAARKKFIVARLGDISLLAAMVLLYLQFGTGNLEIIFQKLQNNSAEYGSVGIEAAAILLVLAALLKSAQIPTHGWLIEVMETPTPVSALLHAGLLNAGPFLIIRMAFVMEASTYAKIILIVIGGLTALFASVVYLTQTSVKTALGYSSVAHMGFSLLVCGLGVYPAAMLHLVAHSFYKAHAFLSSGSVIESIRTSRFTKPKRLGNPLRIVLGIMLACGLYMVFAMVWGIDPDNEFALLAIGAIIVMGLSRLITSAIDSNSSFTSIIKTLVLSLIILTSFFSLESGVHYLLGSDVPEPGQPAFSEIILISSMLVIFAAAVLLQILAPVLPETLHNRSIVIHLRNGLYMNAIFDRVVRALYSHGSQDSSVVIHSMDSIEMETNLFKESIIKTSELNPVE